CPLTPPRALAARTHTCIPRTLGAITLPTGPLSVETLATTIADFAPVPALAAALAPVSADLAPVDGPLVADREPPPVCRAVPPAAAGSSWAAIELGAGASASVAEALPCSMVVAPRADAFTMSRWLRRFPHAAARSANPNTTMRHLR